MEEQQSDEKEQAEDAELRKIVNTIAETNRKIDDEYDEKIKRLDEKRRLNAEDKEKEERDERLSVVKEKLADLKAMVGDARRSGKDPFIADLMLRNINAKIKMASVTDNKHDFDVIESIMKDAENELKEAMAEEPLDVKKEIQKRLRETVQKETGKVNEEEN
ncbi:MAG: hypothetical protein V1866_00555 [archaeon]